MTLVLWRVTPLFASWLATPNTEGTRNHILSLLRRPRPSVVELGCGISPLCALALRPLVSSYLLTDQPYVQRLVTKNLAANPPPASHPSSSHKIPSSKRIRGGVAAAATDQQQQHGHVRFQPLDWETDQVTADLASPHGDSFDAVVACDCVFNYALIAPFVQTCADVCALRRTSSSSSSHSYSQPSSSRNDGHGGSGQQDQHHQPRRADDDDDDDDAGDEDGDPCLCIVAQQLRNDDVFLEWLRAFSDRFNVWRVPEDVLPEGLRPGDGFVVHVGVLKDHEQRL
ncbi:Ribosomal protein lysine methyltransferase, variant 2 [Purpureocillium takamizusanense]|uniref:Ribosomal protein lysine methyltransferase, variant 2 n=1 Tax=Purpureocillium takamizusanense TaxID=2060973 RepID=A0A9Q8QLP0_9HYPO|nr:Ribosomal protein lysine methyltransferase, variant 2 [Purpureocillium takamizusanense]UNI21915.1 Ribosomal protein lysine methyltransferase, variant 2 [Purpureocillium takamizusanense]